MSTSYGNNSGDVMSYFLVFFSQLDLSRKARDSIVYCIQVYTASAIPARMEERVLKMDERTAVDVRQVSEEVDVKLVSWRLTDFPCL